MVSWGWRRGDEGGDSNQGVPHNCLTRGATLQSDRETKTGAAESSRPRRNARVSDAQRKARSSEARSFPFSPQGRHGALRGLLLQVGDVLGRDKDASLSAVSLQGLRKALSDFLGESRNVKLASRAESYGGSTSNRSGSGATRSSLTKEDREKLNNKLQRNAEDRAAHARLKGGSDAN